MSSSALSLSLSSELPQRLVIFVDGTYCTPDGRHGPGYGNITNVYRIYAATKEGECYDETVNKTFNQVKIYKTGIGSTDGIGAVEKLAAGAFGKSYQEWIHEIYETCCKYDAQDEIWLFGFSRGAYIVRAVAGLLNKFSALKSAGTPAFKVEYARTLEVSLDQQKRARFGPGQIYDSSLRTKQPAKIQFVGVFDTVKALHDGNWYDTSFNDSIHHFRHALALNETRKNFTAEYIYPDYRDIGTQPKERSFVQAWFLGTHTDMGGSAKRDGLALYPLQWMMFESRSKGLVLDFLPSPNPKANIDNPLQVVFPQSASEGKGYDKWVFTTENGIKINVQDIRGVHNLKKYEERYKLKLNNQHSWLWPKQARAPFSTDGVLKGYFQLEPHGTIIHPSVYQLLDEKQVTSLQRVRMLDHDKINAYKPIMLGDQYPGPWLRREPQQNEDLKAIRILVCGNTGVGKSTLINRVFGVDDTENVTESSSRERGEHDVWQELIHINRPDIIIHDSGGFEAGDLSQLEKVTNFVQHKSSQVDLKDRLHIVWLCLEMNSARTMDTATQKLFEAVSQFADEVPIIIVATKQDEFIAIKRYQADRQLAKSIPDPVKRLEQCQADSEAAVQERLQLIEGELTSIGRFQAAVSVAESDEETIKQLVQVTSQNVNEERVSLLFVAAQVADLDIKVDLAVSETMTVYKRVVYSTTALAAVPLASASNRAASAITIVQGILECFGLPGISSTTVHEIIKRNVWDDLGHNISIGLAETIAVFGVGYTALTGGMPFFLAAQAINTPIVVPATTRLMLMLAVDVILILTRAFKETACRCIGQPFVEDVEKAAKQCRGVSKDAHKDVMKLIPRRNPVKSIRYSKVDEGFKEIVLRYKQVVTEETFGSDN